MLHLVFVKIHPFEDGNGRTARQLEKWFLAQKLGPKAWYIQSERYYYEQHQKYYDAIRLLGLEYEELQYSEALPFMKMLPGSLNYEWTLLGIILSTPDKLFHDETAESLICSKETQ